MIKATELGFDNGEYVFFNIDLFSRCVCDVSKKNWSANLEKIDYLVKRG